ncbi:MAG: hypothetical protein VX438_18595 [Planctomycetota bacterium]|nr:hypothetical protein [Planctomycetota bacterium]
MKNTNKYIVGFLCSFLFSYSTCGLAAQEKPGVVKAVSSSNQEFEAAKQEILRQIDFKDATISDASRMISELSNLNVVATHEAGEKGITLFMKNVRAIDAVETTARVAGLWFREDPNTQTIRIMTTEEYQDDIIIRRDDVTRVFTLLHPNAVSVATSIRNLYGNRVRLSITSFDDDMLLQQGAMMSSGLAFGGMMGGGMMGGGMGMMGGMGGRFGGNTSGFGNVGGSMMGRGMMGGGMMGGMMGGGMMGGGMMGGGFGGMGGGFGGMGGGFGGNANNQQVQSIRDQILDETLSTEQLNRIQKSLDRQPNQDGTVTTTDVSEAAQKEQTIFVTLNRSHNLVMVRTGDKDAMEAIEKLINEIDRPTPQVLLEMKIIEVSLDDDFRSIFDIQFNNGPQGPSVANQNLNNPFLSDATTAAKNIAGLGNFPAEGGTFVYQFLNDNIRARIELLQTNNRIDTLATPLLLASNNRPARIFVGEERVLVRSVNSTVIAPGLGNATTGISPVTEITDIGTSLFIVPKINADRTVTLIVNQNNSTVNVGAANIPVAGQNGVVTNFPIDTVNTSNISGTVVAKDGLSVAIGGLIRENTTDAVQRVPILGDLPWIGAPFRRTVQSTTKSELVLLITPHVITTPIEGLERSADRIKQLSENGMTDDYLSPEKFISGPNQPWTPSRLNKGYQRTVGEPTGVAPAGKKVRIQGN